MKRSEIKVTALITLLVVIVSLFPVKVYSAGTSSKALGYLNSAMDKMQKAYYVYNDFCSPENHFSHRALICSTGADANVPAMDEGYTTNPQSGTDCIKCSVSFNRRNIWGGWYFMNGIMQKGDAAPKENWGDYKNAGIDLTGALKLTFYAKGSKGGERVEFFCFGVGRNSVTGKAAKPYPDSSKKITLGNVRLTAKWQKYTIDVSKKDIKYVLGAFGWVASASNNNYKDIVFYLDNIQYDLARPNELSFIPSYETNNSQSDFDLTQKNVAYVYDSAVALLAYLSSETKDGIRRAGKLADALVYAQNNDRFYDDGRIRNAYQAGDLVLPAGWVTANGAGKVRMPGWYDKENKTWYEDKSQVSTYTGNVAWAMLALLGYYQSEGGKKYLDAALRMGVWVENNCRDDNEIGGYTAGFEGWEPKQAKLAYKSTEHNIDLYAAFKRLYLITKDRIWLDRANHALKMVNSMWDGKEKKFWTGTKADGITINKSVVPLDIQAWSLLSLKKEGEKYIDCLEYAAEYLNVGNGFDFNNDKDGIWSEGTAQMADIYKVLGRNKEYEAAISAVKKVQASSGGVSACNKESISTGFWLDDKIEWRYYNRVHLGATAWLVLAEKGANPFWLGNKITDPDEIQTPPSKATPTNTAAPTPTPGIPGGEGTPVIEYTSIPEYGSYENISGRVLHVDPSKYNIAVYIYVYGWWTKPYWDTPATSINDDGTWSCDITTGGYDQNATQIAAYLVPSTYTPPKMGGGENIPAELMQKAIAYIVTER